jgi:hypothetical protein
MRRQDNGLRWAFTGLTIHSKSVELIKLLRLSSFPKRPSGQGLQFTTSKRAKSLFLSGESLGLECTNHAFHISKRKVKVGRVVSAKTMDGEELRNTKQGFIIIESPIVNIRVVILKTKGANNSAIVIKRGIEEVQFVQGMSLSATRSEGFRSKRNAKARKGIGGTQTLKNSNSLVSSEDRNVINSSDESPSVFLLSNTGRRSHSESTGTIVEGLDVDAASLGIFGKVETKKRMLTGNANSVVLLSSER